MMASDPVCEVCGAADPRWLRWIDRSAVDYAWRRFHAVPGPTSLAVHYCESEACAAEVEARYGAQGNDAALEQLRRDMLARLEEHRP